MLKMNHCNKNAMPCMRGDCKKQMQVLRALDFAIQETVLYLDAYPDCRGALDYYHRLMEERKAAMAEYENNCGPVTMYGNVDQQHWRWIDSPWPWDSDAN